jgi:hypothetical protein
VPTACVYHVRFRAAMRLRLTVRSCPSVALTCLNCTRFSLWGGIGLSYTATTALYYTVLQSIAVAFLALHYSVVEVLHWVDMVKVKLKCALEMPD